MYRTFIPTSIPKLKTLNIHKDKLVPTYNSGFGNEEIMKLFIPFDN